MEATDKGPEGPDVLRALRLIAGGDSLNLLDASGVLAVAETGDMSVTALATGRDDGVAHAPVNDLAATQPDRSHCYVLAGLGSAPEDAGPLRDYFCTLRRIADRGVVLVLGDDAGRSNGGGWRLDRAKEFFAGCGDVELTFEGGRFQPTYPSDAGDKEREEAFAGPTSMRTGEQHGGDGTVSLFVRNDCAGPGLDAELAKVASENGGLGKPERNEIVLGRLALRSELEPLLISIEGFRRDLRLKDAQLARRDAQVRDLSQKLAESISLVAKERRERGQTEAKLEEIRSSGAWPIAYRVYLALVWLRDRPRRAWADVRQRFDLPELRRIPGVTKLRRVAGRLVRGELDLVAVRRRFGSTDT